MPIPGRSRTSGRFATPAFAVLSIWLGLASMVGVATVTVSRVVTVLGKAAH